MPISNSFDEIAKWFEGYFESLVGPECAMTFADTLRLYRDVQNSCHELYGEEWRQRVDALEKEADQKLMEFFLRYLNAKGYRVGSDPDGRLSLEPSEN